MSDSMDHHDVDPNVSPQQTDVTSEESEDEKKSSAQERSNRPYWDKVTEQGIFGKIKSFLEDLLEDHRSPNEDPE